MSNLNKLICIAAVSVVFAAMPALAQSLTGNVGSAGITDGEQAVETRFGVDGENNMAARVHYDYSPTGWYQIRVIASLSKPDGGNWNANGVTFENWFQWSEERDDDTGFNGGLRVSYGLTDEGPDEFETRLTLTDKFADHWEWRANVIAEIEAGAQSEGGVALETRLQLTRSLEFAAMSSPDLQLGFEAFSEFGNSRNIPELDRQAHQVGPVLKASWDSGVYLQTAVRVGVTDGADDTMFKVFLGREF